jgi:hypothetical protein
VPPLLIGIGVEVELGIGDAEVTAPGALKVNSYVPVSGPSVSEIYV